MERQTGIGIRRGSKLTTMGDIIKFQRRGNEEESKIHPQVKGAGKEHIVRYQKHGKRLT